MRVEYFRFLLSRVKEPVLPFHRDTKSREEVIQELFDPKQSPYRFKAGRSDYGFVSVGKAGNIVVGKFGKHSARKLHSSPDKQFKQKTEEDWPFCHVYINLDDEAKTGRTFQAGQVLAIQVNYSAISNNRNALRALADHINRTLIFDGFHISFNPILADKKKFWTVVGEHNGNIRKLVLTYTPPNIFKLNNKLEDDLKEANSNFNTTSTQIVLENDGGQLTLPRDNPLLEQSARYIDAGSGTYTFHLQKGKKIIRSDDGIKTEIFEGIEVELAGTHDTIQSLAPLLKDIINGKK